MTTGDRIQAIQRFGFSRRQAAFLVTVMSYSGVCLPRQYATLAGIAYGHRVNRFFERLVGRGFVSACPCLHNRAFVYRVHHRALYGAIGEPQSRFRRPVPAAAVTPRLMLLDAVLEAPEVTWLASEEDKVEHFTTCAGDPARLPASTGRQSRTARRQTGCFPTPCPSASSRQAGRSSSTLQRLASLDDFRPFLRRHVALLTALPAWTLRLVITPDDRPRNAAWQAVIDREIGPLLGLAGHTERRVEWWRLGHRYGHLSPLVASTATSPASGSPGGTRGGTPARTSSTPSSCRSGRREDRAEGVSTPTTAAGPTTPGRAWGSARPRRSVSGRRSVPPERTAQTESEEDGA